MTLSVTMLHMQDEALWKVERHTGEEEEDRVVADKYRDVGVARNTATTSYSSSEGVDWSDMDAW